MRGIPRGVERPIGCAHDEQNGSCSQRFPAATDRWIDDGQGISALESCLFPVQVEDGRPVEEHVELLLPTLALVVLLDEQLPVVAGDEDVGPERVDAERMLERIPDRSSLSPSETTGRSVIALATQRAIVGA